MEHKYSFHIEWSEEDQEYVATCSSFPGLSALGETEEEALKEGKVALQLFIDACLEQGVALPKPHLNEGYSGQFRVRTSKNLHKRAVKIAAEEGVSLNQYVNYAIAEKVVADESASKIQKRLDRTLKEINVRLRETVVGVVSIESTPS